MTRLRCGTLMLLTLILVPHVAHSASSTLVKLATLVPDGSVWHNILEDMGDEWNRDTQGRVTLRIYPGGVAGDEPDMVRKMRIGQIHASALTVRGLAELDDAFEVFTVPMLLRSYEELYHLLEQMGPTLKKRLEDKGWVLLSWGHAGWVYFFTKNPVRSVEDLRKAKIWVWAGDEPMVQMWKENGFHPVALAATDILTGLQTGMIDALPTVPLGALQLQWFRVTNYMVDQGLAPLVGGLVVARKTWEKISAADRAQISAASRKLEERLKNLIPDQDRQAIREMKVRGLEVVELPPDKAGEFRRETEAFARKMRGSLVPPEIMDLAMRELEAFRKQPDTARQR